MLTCHGCMRHCLQTLIGDSLVVSRPASSATLPKPLRRTYYTSTPKPKSEALRTPSQDGYGYGYKDRQQAREQDSRSEERRKWIQSRGVRPADKTKPRPDDDFVIRKHLSYLKDPLKLADFVRSTLRSGDFETAQQVVRAASKNVQCTVGWNHLIDYQLEQHKMNAAIKTYNEMKKRAQHPDAYTYTIIFRGCAAHPDTTHALEKCMAMYQTMRLEKSPIKPNTIHMNVLLKMCTRANNVEAMFAIAGSFDRKGLAAPNNLTFTTILNGLRMSTVLDSRSELSPMQKRENTRGAILEARRTWAHLVKLWRSGEIWIDEELVASMGRILLAGEIQDVDDILSLVEQAMNIPRQIPPRTKTPDEVLAAQAEAALATEAIEAPASTEATTSEATEDNAEDLLPPSTELFAPKALSKPPTKGTTGYAKPGPNTLSLLMSACLALKSKDAATKYWQLFTSSSSFGVAPDVENYHAYLRILRMFRSSSETVSVLLHMKPQDLEHKTFRIAMSTCERDKLNRNAFANAGKVLDLMQNSHMREESIAVLISYLQIAVSAPTYSEQGGRLKLSKHAQGWQIVRALDRLEPFMRKIKAMLLITNPGLDEKAPLERHQLNADFVLLVRRMISACDQLVHKGLVTRDVAQDMRAHRARLAAFLDRPRFSQFAFRVPTPLVPMEWGATDEEPVVEEKEAEKASKAEANEEKEKRSKPSWGARIGQRLRHADMKKRERSQPKGYLGP